MSFISLLLFHCESEHTDTLTENQITISLDKVKQQFKASFNKKAFYNLPNPQWNNIKTFYDPEGNYYFEIPFQSINDEDIKNSTSISFDKLLVTPTNNSYKLNIAHYFSMDKNVSNVEAISHTQPYGFSGFVSIYDLNKNVIDIKQFANGVDTKKTTIIKDSRTDDNLRAIDEDENVVEHTETICTRGCLYWEYEGGDIEVITCSPWDCTSYTYQTYSSNGGGNTSSTSHNTNKTVKCEEGYTRNYDGKCVKDEMPNVINNLTGKADCVYTKLEAINGNLFKSTIGKFIDDPKYDLIFNNGNCVRTDEACTDTSNLNTTGEITVTLENVGQGGLGIAALILHEGIHAEMHRFVSRHESGVDPNNRPRLFQLYAFYKGWAQNSQDEDYNWVEDAHHQYMVENYVNKIASTIRELDNNKYPPSHYIAYGWEGLRSYGYTSKRLTSAENTQYITLQAIVNAVDNTCE